MEEQVLKELWRSTNEKLEKNLVLNKENTEEITQMKVESLIGSMKPIKLFTLLIGILWVAFVDFLLVKFFQTANLSFLISAVIHLIFTKLAIGIYLYQFLLIQRIDVGKPIIETQEKLTRLKSSSLWVARLLFLQSPVWTTFYWNASMLGNGNLFLYLFQFTVTFAILLISVWLFFNIKYENKDKKWFRFIFNDKEWAPILHAIELYKAIEKTKVEL